MPVKGDQKRQVSLRPIAGLTREMILETHDGTEDLVSRKIHEEGVWEPFETSLWIASQREGDVVLDVGANLGYFSILSALHERRPSRILAFEPAADNVTLLRNNLELNACVNQVEVEALALGEQDIAGSLHRNDHNRGDHQIYSGDGVRSQEPIVVRRGAALLSSRIDRIDLLKVDTQGSEHAVIKGLLPLLRESVPTLRILLELTPFSLRLANSSGRELVTLIASLGLPLWIVDHVAHQLVPSDAAALCEWSDNVDGCAGDRGFMNIYAGVAPEGVPS